MAVPHRRSLIRGRIPRRNLYIPIYYAQLQNELRLLPILLFNSALNVALCGSFCHVLALVIELFALAQTDLHFNSAVLKVEAYGNQGIAGLLYDPVKAVDLLFVHKQLPYAHRIAVEDIALLIRGNMHSVYKDLALYDRAPAVLEVDSALTDRFYLGAEQLDACLIAFLNKIIVVRLFVLRDRFQ